MFKRREYNPPSIPNATQAPARQPCKSIAPPREGRLRGRAFLQSALLGFDKQVLGFVS
jgi:hypothetical protein